MDIQRAYVLSLSVAALSKGKSALQHQKELGLLNVQVAMNRAALRLV